MASTDHSRFQFAAERYILDELPEAEKLAFEEHYFECGACAQDVEDLTNLRLAAPIMLARLDREVPKSQSVSWFARQWMPQLTWGALASLMLITGYQNAVQIPELKTRTYDSVQVIPPAKTLVSHRGPGTVTIPGLPQWAPVQVQNEWPVNYPKYDIRITRHGAKETVTQTASELGQGLVGFAIPAKRLGAGTFDLIISGIPASGTEKEVAQFSFTIQGE